jgi:hypothetical protein
MQGSMGEVILYSTAVDIEGQQIDLSAAEANLLDEQYGRAVINADYPTQQSNPFDNLFGFGISFNKRKRRDSI